MWASKFGTVITTAQKMWYDKMNEGIRQTTRILAQVKEIKLLGFEDTLTEYLEQLRLTEVAFMCRYRLFASTDTFLGMYLH